MKRDPDLDEEIRSHLEMAIAERMARGESRASAEAAARREFGNVGHVKEVTRESWGGVWVERLGQDLRFAVRSLRRAPAFTAVAVTMLALGIGVNTAMFTVVNGVLVRPLPFPDPDRLVLVAYSPPRSTFMPYPGMFDRSYAEFRKRDAIFESSATFHTRLLTLTNAGEPIRLQTHYVTPDFFKTLGVGAAHGRTFLRGDDEAGHDAIVILSDEIWRSRFNADPNIIGAAITLDAAPRVVVGIMPPGFDFPFESKIWVPLRLEIDPGNTRLRTVVARLKPGMSRDQAARMFAPLASQLELMSNQKRDEFTAEVLPLQTLVVGDARRPLLVLAGAVALVLLIACTNVANLLLMRATSREHEIALRAALGADRPRLIRQLLTESTLLAVVGGICGLVIARWGVRAVVALAPAGKVPRVDQIHLDGRVLAFTMLVSLAVGIGFGLVPALFATRRDLRDSLGAGTRTTGHGHGWLRGSLVVSQIAVALVLLVGAGLMIRSFERMRAVPLGFRPERVVMTTVVVNEGKYRTAGAMHEFNRRALEELARIPGVSAAGAVNYRPLGGTLTAGDFTIETGPKPPPNRWADKLAVGGDYFATMGIRIRAGRAFTARDDERSPRVIIVSQSVARRFWGASSPLGQRLATTDHPVDSDWMTIVGVVDDVVQTGVTARPDAALYQPIAQVPQTFFLADMSFAVRAASANGVDAVAPAMRRALHEADPELAVPTISTMENLVAATTGDSRFQTQLLATFSALALLLAAVGIYGVLAYGVSERFREIGVRMALGATSSDVVRMVARRTMALVLPGLAAGALAALGATRLLSKLLFGVTPTDPVTFSAVVVLLALAAAAAAVFPARKASRVDPLVALRE
jgi:predicted permease